MYPKVLMRIHHERGIVQIVLYPKSLITPSRFPGVHWRQSWKTANCRLHLQTTIRMLIGYVFECSAHLDLLQACIARG